MLLRKKMLNFDNLRHTDFPKCSLKGTLNWFGIPVLRIVVRMENLISGCNDLIFQQIVVIGVRIVPVRFAVRKIFFVLSEMPHIKIGKQEIEGISIEGDLNQW